jgi:N-acetylmuramoyl-L-alanine amidase
MMAGPNVPEPTPGGRATAGMMLGRSPRPPRSQLLLSLGLVAGLLFAGVPAGTNAASISDTVASVSASPRVFYPNGDGVNDTTALHYELTRPAKVSVQIVDYVGHLVRTLRSASAQEVGAHDVAWNGRSSSTGGQVQDAGYRFKLTVSNELGTFSALKLVTKARHAIYSPNPGSITVAIDPGHGGPDPGAIRTPVAEKTPNLDIALRLRAMLQGAGVNVVMTRTSDNRVNRKNIDWTRDGKVGYRDELASRIEVANTARADVFVVIHNNGTPYGVGGTETWYDSTRTFASANRQLAGFVQSSLLTYLRTRRTASWSPKDRGVKAAPFYVLRSYKAGFCARPSQMPGILGESLAMGHPFELRLLRSGGARQTIAEGYYEGLASFFKERKWGARYDVVEAPSASAKEGTDESAKIKVTNRSPNAWADGAVKLTLSSVTARSWYDGTNSAGKRLATIALPALGPGESADVDVPFKVPSYASAAAHAGKTILKFDLLSGTTRLASAGVPPLQIWMTIKTAAPTPTPSPTPTPTPSPEGKQPGTNGGTPTPTPTRKPTPTPTATPTPTTAPSATPTPTPNATPTPTPTPTDTPTPAANPTPMPTEPPPADAEAPPA